MKFDTDELRVRIRKVPWGSNSSGLETLLRLVAVVEWIACELDSLPAPAPLKASKLLPVPEAPESPLPEAGETPFVLFVCSGNICRSPMAEWIARDRFRKKGIPVRVRSAGILGLEARSASRYAVDVMQEIGFDLTSHRSQDLPYSSLHQAEAIVVMEPRHELLLSAFSEALREKIYRLWEFTDEPGRLSKIEDPVGRGYEEFVRCRNDIQECLENWIGVVQEKWHGACR